MAVPKDDWTFELRAMEGPVLIRPGRFPEGWTIKAVMVNGVDAIDTGIPLRPGQAIDGVQKTNAKLGTCVIGVGGVTGADLEKLQTTHKLTTPLTVATDTDGPGAYKLNKSAAVTVLVYKRGGDITQSYGFSDTKSAVAKAAEIAAAAKSALE